METAGGWYHILLKGTRTYESRLSSITNHVIYVSAEPWKSSMKDFIPLPKPQYDFLRGFQVVDNWFSQLKPIKAPQHQLQLRFLKGYIYIYNQVDQSMFHWENTISIKKFLCILQPPWYLPVRKRHVCFKQVMMVWKNNTTFNYTVMLSGVFHQDHCKILNIQIW